MMCRLPPHLQPNPRHSLPSILRASAAPPLHPTWSWWAIVSFKQMDGEQRGERDAPLCLSPLVSLPTRLWVIFSSFQGTAMNNLSLLSETQAVPQPPHPYLTLCRLTSAGCSMDSISLPRFLLSVSGLHTQSGFFVSRGVLQGPEINWGCGWMTSGPSLIKAWVLKVCRVYNEVCIS